MKKKQPETPPESSSPVERIPVSVRLAEHGIHTSQQFARLMSAMMADTLADQITPQKANAVGALGRNLLKVVDMEYRYGTRTVSGGAKVLDLVLSAPVTPKAIAR